MKVLIIEDEQPAAHKLIRLLEEADKQIEVIDVLASIEQTINWLAVHPGPELIFMDIQLEDGISFEIFETCKIQTPVIFTTAYDEYTLNSTSSTGSRQIIPDSNRSSASCNLKLRNDSLSKSANITGRYKHCPFIVFLLWREILLSKPTPEKHIR